MEPSPPDSSDHGSDTATALGRSLLQRQRRMEKKSANLRPNLRVGVIGAGPAGLTMCKYLANEPKIDFVAFEKSYKIGGLWQYMKDDEDRRFHNAMYKTLRTIFPKELMAFADFPFPEHLPSFVSREEVLKYVENYADHFDLRKNIKLLHEVTSVKPCEDQEQLTWQVVTKHLKTGKMENEVFDAVVVCNGHYSVPRCPDVPGMDEFPGTVTHSIDFDVPGVYKDQTVVILGAQNSGLDICFQVSEVAKKVYLVHYNKKVTPPLPENVEEITGTLTHGFSDGSVEINHEWRRFVDSVIFCTGYHYAIPFLEPECKIEVQNNRVTSLYKHVFNTAYPSLSFIGLCFLVAPFPNYSKQAQWVTSVLSGRDKLPSREEMIRDEEMDYQEKLNAGVKKEKMHTLGVERHESYNNELAERAGVEALPPSFHSMFKFIFPYQTRYPRTYKNTNFSVTDDEWHIVST